MVKQFPCSIETKGFIFLSKKCNVEFRLRMPSRVHVSGNKACLDCAITKMHNGDDPEIFPPDPAQLKKKPGSDLNSKINNYILVRHKI